VSLYIIYRCACTKCMHTWRTSLFSSSQRLETLSMASLSIAGASASSFVKCLCASAAAFSPSPHPCVCVCEFLLCVCVFVCVRVTFFFLFLLLFPQCSAPHLALDLLTVVTHAHVYDVYVSSSYDIHDTLVSAQRTAFADWSTRT
jgi:hypothetical protein